ncbi:NAD(P)H-hydrate dehydratase [Allohahella sp. A8]|uniref:NAD(P)H-hydrate dehydratase n=1 Tax=Allohahella sp. A8 TaxID=3141461 RepID=UPI003A800920
MRIYSRANSAGRTFTQPLPVYGIAQLREIDARLCEQHGDFALMQMAARAAFRLLRKRWPDCKRLSIVVGGGNNGGDGLVMARLALQHGIAVQLVYGLDVSSLEAVHAELNDRSEAFRELRANVDADGAVAEFEECLFKEGARLELSGDLVVDALYGIGLQGELRFPGPDLIRLINESAKPVFAVDCPSGLDCELGAVMDTAVRADLTCTFIALKKGLLTHQAAEFVGELQLEPLGFEAETAADATDYMLIGRKQALQFLPARSPVSHKGNFGKVLCAGGDEGMGGAILLTAESCSRGGAGVVMSATRSAHVTAGLSRSPEIMWRGVENRSALCKMLEAASCIAIGPGLGREPWGQMCWQTVLSAVQERQLPCVIDADGLNQLAKQPCELGPRVCLTPHPGEAATLMNALYPDDNSTAASINADRFESVVRLCQGYGCCVLLKGAGGLVAWPESSDSGDRRTKVAVVASAHPALASGGMGDVLTGLLAAQLAQGLPAWQAAVRALHLQLEAVETLQAHTQEPAVTAARVVQAL